MTSVIGTRERTHDYRHWRARRKVGYTRERSVSLGRRAGRAMRFKHGQIIQTQSFPLTGWYLRWIPWVVSVFACVGYLSGVLTTQPLTLPSLLLLTGTYGAWLVIYHIGVRRPKVRAHPSWLLALFCLACASQFIPEPSTNVYWLPQLPL